MQTRSQNVEKLSASHLRRTPTSVPGRGPAAAAFAPRVLQRKCACDDAPGLDGECAGCRDKRVGLQRKPADQAAVPVPPIVNEVLNSPGRPLDSDTRSYMEPRFGHHFDHVRVHTDARAAGSARAVNALAYTVGSDVVFGAGQYAPSTDAGRRLIAHELTHTIQQGAADGTRLAASPASSPMATRCEAEAERTAANVIEGRTAASVMPGASTPGLQRQAHGTPSPGVRSPAFEELVTQVSTVQAGFTGRRLSEGEERLARSIFGASIDYARVRLIPTGFLEYRTVANTIRVPEDFTIDDEYMAQTLIHEMTHVWQYQHGGTSYISVSLAAQIAGTIRTGSRNAAYDYQIKPGMSFFDLTPEQQGLLVENYFSMLRDQRTTGRQSYTGNHLDSRGEFQTLSEAERKAEISRELPLHEPLIKQMQAALPRPEVSLLSARATEVMRTPFDAAAPVREDLRIAPVKPLLEVRF